MISCRKDSSERLVQGAGRRSRMCLQTHGCYYDAAVRKATHGCNSYHDYSIGPGVYVWSVPLWLPALQSV